MNYPALLVRFTLFHSLLEEGGLSLQKVKNPKYNRVNLIAELGSQSKEEPINGPIRLDRLYNQSRNGSITIDSLDTFDESIAYSIMTTPTPVINGFNIDWNQFRKKPAVIDQQLIKKEKKYRVENNLVEYE